MFTKHKTAIICPSSVITADSFITMDSGIYKGKSIYWSNNTNMAVSKH